jgi:peptide deformylase
MNFVKAPFDDARDERRFAAVHFLDSRSAKPYFQRMAILPIVEIPDPRLRQISKPVEQVDDDLRRLIDDMFETMYAAPGIGLAAIQVGVPKRVLVIDLQEQETEDGEPIRDPRVFINPEILETSDHEVPYNEGCLSVPEMYAEVDRPDRIRARWLDRDGNQKDEEITGLLAVCLQHEMDHLNGILFIDHISRLKREMLLKKLAKLRREQGKKAA